ncbi:MAG: TaqI-like C-terminal specificity domain-containing protein, partial [Patescibacteria group bacterium]|nr:TaqI-like C-terminal specificity domain-containing protein [Patescibacteria group bacterium]
VVKKDPKIKADFEGKGVDTVNFAKKLLGQIIFLYFLQKKGWFGVGRDDDWDTGSKHFLRELFKKKHGDYNNFFNDILEPLFYDALRNDRSHDDGYYSRFNCKIPFLNGGLFDPIGNYDWVHTDILLPNKLFSNQTKTKEGDTGTGILDVFDRYNFTVKEDEPLEKEVAIDPELLGKSYEKFNAIRPDNFAEFKKALKSDRKGEENKFNKKFGVYYTPREIVHYMCQQSLINYLDTAVNTHKQSITTKPSVQKKIFGPQSPVQQTLTSDSYKPIISKENIETLIQIGEQFSENEARVLSKGKETKTYSHQLPESIRKNAKLIDDKLAEITVCDPAVGSGAFPVGMMSEIVKTRNVLSVFINEKDRTTYNFKRQCIEYSLYGVDIDPGAVEIAKLRLWLSLVVDEDDIKNIKPLPNLDYRIMQGNSLISEFIGINFDDDKNTNLKKEIEALNAEEKLLIKEKADKESKSSRHYKKTKEIDQNLLNEINVLDDKINKLKKKRTLLNKKLNHQEESPEIINFINEFQKKKNTFLNESNVSRKTKLKEEVNDLLVKIFETKLKIQKADYFNRLKNIENKYSVVRNERQRDELIKQDKEKFYKESGFDLESAEKQLKEFTSGKKIKPFFLWNVYFSEVFLSGAKSAYGEHNKGGFDVVIANPPYVSATGLSNIEKSGLKKNFKTAKGRIDTYGLFTEKAIRLTSERGCVSYIVPNKFLTNLQFKFLRKLILDSCCIVALAYPKETIFEAAAVNNIIFVLQKIKGDSKENKVYIVEIDQNIKRERFAVDQDVYERDSNYTFLLSFSENISNIKNKIRDQSVALSVFCDVKDGIIAGRIKDKLFVDKSVNRHCKRLVFGEDMERYHLFWGGKYVDYRPGIMKREERIRIGVDKGLGLRLRVPSIFETPKILTRKTADRIIAAYDSDGYYFEQTLHGIIAKNTFPKLKYILGILNSKLYDYYYKNIVHQSGTIFPQVRIGLLKQLPIYNIDRKRNSEIELHDTIVSIVNQILSFKKSSQNDYNDAQVRECEKQIDEIVYRLYDLTPEEIKIVEGKDDNAD